MKILKRMRVTLALVLTLTFIALVPMNTVAAARNGKYVSDVYVAYGKDADAAKQTLEEKGFIPVEGNLNDGGKTYVMLGYKTTGDIRESITDLAVMNMNGGYSVEDYKTFLKSQKNRIAEFLNEFMSVIKEYRANLKAGKTKATVVHELLNNYTDDDTGMKMGDLLNSATLQDELGIQESIEASNPENLPNLITILMQGNAQVIKSIEVLLSMAADPADNTWIDRFAELDYDTLLDDLEDSRPDLNTESKRRQYLDNVYGEAASELGKASVILREKLSDYEEMSLYLEDVTEKGLEENFGNAEKDYKAVLQTKEWVAVATIYENLKNYEGENFNKGELLELFMEDNDPDDEEIFYPMAAALSEGQRNGMPFIGFDQLLQFAFATEESWKQVAQSNQAEMGGFDSVSVYANIDRGVYADDGSVAITDKAQREKTVGSVGTNGNLESQDDVLLNIIKISWAATAFVAMASMFSIGVAYVRVRDYAYGGKEIGWIQENLDDIFKLDKASLDELATMPMYAENASQIYSARLAIYISKILVITTIFLSVASAVLTIIDLLRDNDKEQPPIPKYLVDNYTDADGGSYQLNYKAVECNREEYFGEDHKVQKGSNADLIADEGAQWLALYASKNSKAGNGRPLIPFFAVQQNSKAPTGFDSNIHLDFGGGFTIRTHSGRVKLSVEGEEITNEAYSATSYPFSSSDKTMDFGIYGLVPAEVISSDGSSKSYATVKQAWNEAKDIEGSTVKLSRNSTIKGTLEVEKI